MYGEQATSGSRQESLVLTDSQQASVDSMNRYLSELSAGLSVSVVPVGNGRVRVKGETFPICYIGSAEMLRYALHGKTPDQQKMNDVVGSANAAFASISKSTSEGSPGNSTFGIPVDEAAAPCCAGPAAGSKSLKLNV